METSHQLTREQSQAVMNYKIHGKLKSQEISALTERLNEAKKIKEAIEVHLIGLEKKHAVALNFQLVISKTYPEAYKQKVIQSLFAELFQKDYATTDAFSKDLANILFRIYFSEGKDKVYDFKDVTHLNMEKGFDLFRQGIFIQTSWMNALINCLTVKSKNNRLALIQITPDWLWAKCFRLFIHLSALTMPSTKKESTQQSTEHIQNNENTLCVRYQVSTSVLKKLEEAGAHFTEEKLANVATVELFFRKKASIKKQTATP